MEQLRVDENVKVVVPNRFIRARLDRDMDVNAQKLFRMAIAQCRMNDEDFGIYQVTGSELANYFGVSKQNVYQHVLSWTSSCMKTLMVEEIAGAKKNSFRMYHIFDKCEYVNGVLTMQLHQEMKPFVLEIQKRLGFTQYELARILMMKGKYSIPLFELMVSEMRNQKVYGNHIVRFELYVDEIRRQTGTEEVFKKISQLKDRVLAIAEREIEKSMGVKIEREDIKKGRTVIGFAYTLRSQVFVEDMSMDAQKKGRKAELIRKKSSGVLTPEEDDELQALILELDQMRIEDFM